MALLYSYCVISEGYRKIILKAGVEFYALSGCGMLETQRLGVQALALQAGHNIIEHLLTATRIGAIAYGIAAVGWIAQNPEIFVCQVNTNLMGAPALQFELQQA